MCPGSQARMYRRPASVRVIKKLKSIDSGRCLSCCAAMLARNTPDSDSISGCIVVANGLPPSLLPV